MKFCSHMHFVVLATFGHFCRTEFQIKNYIAIYKFSFVSLTVYSFVSFFCLRTQLISNAIFHIVNEISSSTVAPVPRKRLDNVYGGSVAKENTMRFWFYRFLSGKRLNHKRTVFFKEYSAFMVQRVYGLCYI